MPCSMQPGAKNATLPEHRLLEWLAQAEGRFFYVILYGQSSQSNGKAHQLADLQWNFLQA